MTFSSHSLDFPYPKYFMTNPETDNCFSSDKSVAVVKSVVDSMHLKYIMMYFQFIKL